MCARSEYVETEAVQPPGMVDSDLYALAAGKDHKHGLVKIKPLKIVTI
ncbi:unnamed protein product [Pararhodospirillum photometricum DSM 122]|uniref:Uncharacterized protein n=1 Tax=Pararhodospirillum photometricum DSM 122 TaxID=1150469 RepID=H6SPL9_PARPM|nr:unnamed protein product [Pararhodospirillum photometricum DSM 122]